MSATSPSESAYARAVESAWARLRGRPVVLSPREFELVAGWRREGVPLGVVLEVLEHEARRRGGNPRSLRAVAPAVREAAVAVASGRAMAAAPAPAVEPPATESWRRAFETAALPGALRDAIARVLRAADDGVPAPELDEMLDRELPLVAAEDLVGRATDDAQRALAPFRARMEAAEHDRALRRGIADRLRSTLELPRAALSSRARIG